MPPPLLNPSPQDGLKLTSESVCSKEPGTVNGHSSHHALMAPQGTGKRLTRFCIIGGGGGIPIQWEDHGRTTSVSARRDHWEVLLSTAKQVRIITELESSNMVNTGNGNHVSFSASGIRDSDLPRFW